MKVTDAEIDGGQVEGLPQLDFGEKNFQTPIEVPSAIDPNKHSLGQFLAYTDAQKDIFARSTHPDEAWKTQHSIDL